jgi:hypothetical protein
VGQETNDATSFEFRGASCTEIESRQACDKDIHNGSEVLVVVDSSLIKEGGLLKRFN